MPVEFESRAKWLACFERARNLPRAFQGGAVKVSIGSGERHGAIVHDPQDLLGFEIDYRRQTLDLAGPSVPDSAGLGAPDVADAAPALFLGSEVAWRPRVAIKKSCIGDSPSLEPVKKVRMLEDLVDDSLVVIA